MIGQVLDRRYQIIESLDRGGFGQTFLAQDTKRPGNPICVVKQLKPSFYDLELLNKARELFNREAETLQKLGEHEQIPRLLAYFEENQEFYLIQEYILGNTLDRELITDRPLTEDQVIIIVQELLEILDFVHNQNVIHRDIKPSNIIRRKRDHKLVLIDFGAVKRVTSEVQDRTIVIGTPGYIPIEQLSGQPNFGSDIYAVGIIGIQALTGIKPQPYVGGGFPTDAEQNVLWQQYASASDHFAAILTKMLRYDCRERYQSAWEALQDIQNVENSCNTPATLIDQKPEQKISTQKTSEERAKLFKKILTYSFLSAVIIAVPISIRLLSGGFSTVELPLNGKLVKSVLDGQDVCDLLLENIYCEKYFLQGKKGQQVTIEMNSDDFDPYLVLRTPDGNKLGVNGDISPHNWNAKIAINLPSDGKYLVMARTSIAGESGSYTLRAVAKE